jgi:hypothetical protein
VFSLGQFCDAGTVVIIDTGRFNQIWLQTKIKRRKLQSILLSFWLTYLNHLWKFEDFS